MRATQHTHQGWGLRSCSSLQAGGAREPGPGPPWFHGPLYSPRPPSVLPGPNPKRSRVPRRQFCRISPTWASLLKPSPTNRVNLFRLLKKTIVVVSTPKKKKKIVVVQFYSNSKICGTYMVDLGCHVKFVSQFHLTVKFHSIVLATPNSLLARLVWAPFCRA